MDLIRLIDRLQWWWERLYGVLFLGVGALLLYWSGRAFLAYLNGVRTAWSDPRAGLAGVIAAGLSFWVGARLVRRGIPPMAMFRDRGVDQELEGILEEAARLEQTDPAGAQQLLDGYFMREAAATDARRAELRRRAPHDLAAAIQLRRELQDDVKSHALMKRDLSKQNSGPTGQGMLAEVEATERQLQAELLALDTTIGRLKG